MGRANRLFGIIETYNALEIERCVFARDRNFIVDGYLDDIDTVHTPNAF